MCVCLGGGVCVCVERWKEENMYCVWHSTGCSVVHPVNQVDQTWGHPNSLPSLAREINYRLRRNCFLRVRQVKCSGI